MKLLEAMLHPYRAVPALAKLDPLGAKLDKEVSDELDPKLVDNSGMSYVDPFTGKTVKYKKGGRVRAKAKESDDGGECPSNISYRGAGRASRNKPTKYR